MEATPEIIKERQERYDRLNRLLNGYVRTKEEIKEMQEIRRETLFQIALRFKKSQTRQGYKFPRSLSSSPETQLSEQQRVLASRKDLIYNLKTQSLVLDQETKPKRSTIERMETQLVGSDKKQGSSRPHMKPLLNRIDLRIHRLLAKGHRKSTRYFTERSPTQRSPTNVGRLSPLKPLPQKPEKKAKGRQLTQALQASPISVSQQHLNNFRRDRSTQLAPIPRKDLSHQTSPRQKDTTRLTTQEQKNIGIKRSLKKLHTEEGSMKKRLVIETIMNYETAKLDGKTSSGHMTSAVNIKQKNLLQKPIF